MSRCSRGRAEAGTGAHVDTQPRAERLKEVWLGVVPPWISGGSGRGSSLSVLTGSGPGALLKPPKGIATLEVTTGSVW